MQSTFPTTIQDMMTITARNTGGANTTTITIVVDDVAPSISYSNDDIVATLNVSISPHSGPTNTGGAVTSWAISPYPGPAFHFNMYNGVISGTPGILLSRTQYTVYANNSGGSSIAYVNVTINPDAPNISYSPNELNLTRATTSSDLPLSPTNTGGNMQTASFCSSTNSPPLFVVSDHEGTRHVLCNKDLYSIYLNGTQTVSTNQVSGIPFALEIDEDGHLHIGHWTYTYPYAYIHHATNKYGSWQSSDVYNFSGGFDGDDFKMAVGSDDSLHFTYTTTGQGGNSNDLRYLTNQSGSWSSASVASASGGYRTENPQIALNSEDVPHIIYNTYSWGVNVVKYDNNTFTNLFSRSSGYKFGDITIDSNDHVHVTYSKYQGLFYSTNASGSWQSSTIASLGGTVLDTRIALDSNDHPHVMSASITGQYNNYKHVSHYNHNGTSWNGGIITPAMSSISQLRPDIFIDDNDVISTVYHDQSNGNLFTGTGSTIYGYSISPALPNGLRFSQSTGTISGIAYVQMNRTMYTITANNSGGSSTTYINITVDARAPS
ncbi:MAG: putative Ig domain-containing protein, partial [Candidatus Poseidoniaceae archaeon]|nr:putative Ig domain-containing protein [Candidatus Poseidoniaceae archaeon]